MRDKKKEACMRSMSYGRCAAMEIKRGFKERQLWVLMAMTLAYWAVAAALRLAEAMQVYASDVAYGYIKEIGFLNTQSQAELMLGDRILLYYLPFLAAAAYAFSIADDRRTGFSEQTYGRTGFPHYYAAKLAASGVLGGCLCAAQMAMALLTAFLAFGANPFIKGRMAADGVASVVETEFAAYGFSGIYLELGFAQWVLLGVAQLFLTGAFYGLMAGLLAFFTDNKLLIYVLPVFFRQVFSDVIYLAGLPLQESAPSAYAALSNFSLRFSVSSLNTAYTTAVGILCLAFACLLCGDAIEKR